MNIPCRTNKEALIGNIRENLYLPDGRMMLVRMTDDYLKHTLSPNVELTTDNLQLLVGDQFVVSKIDDLRVYEFKHISFLSISDFILFYFSLRFMQITHFFDLKGNVL